MWSDHGKVTFLEKNFFVKKAKHPKICLSFGGSMPIAQIKRCHLPPPLLMQLYHLATSSKSGNIANELMNEHMIIKDLECLEHC